MYFYEAIICLKLIVHTSFQGALLLFVVLLLFLNNVIYAIKYSKNILACLKFKNHNFFVGKKAGNLISQLQKPFCLDVSIVTTFILLILITAFILLILITAFILLILI